MTYSKRASFKTQLIKASLLAFAAISVSLPKVSFAQVSASPVARTVLSDGVYLFGQSPTRDEMGADYAVLSIKDNQTVGAFYQPHSSFDCFSGEVLPNRLAVDVIDSYAQTTHPYDIAVTLEDSLVAGSAVGAYTLEGFHRIEDLSAQDYEILEVCQANLAQ